MKANIETARRGAIDLLKCIKELQELIPQVIETQKQLENRVAELEKKITEG